MKRQFKSKRNIKFKLIIYFIIFIFFFYVFIGIFFNGKTFNIKDILINSALKEILNEESFIIEKLNINLTAPKNILYTSLNKIIGKEDLAVFSSSDEEDLYNYENSKTEYVEDPNPVIVKKPIVYIYNTHQLEEYNMNVLYDYSIKPNVMIASYILKEKLNEKDTPSIVEVANIKKYLNKNKLNYSYSYKASKYFAELTLSKNPSIEYIIDIHRDSARIEKTLYKYKEKEYAKILFVVGMDHKNHKKNLELAIDLNNYIKKEYPGISRGVLKKGGKGVNGIYNQNLSEKSMLIEIGGVDNTINQVYNTCEALAVMISKFIKEREDGK